MEHTHFTAPPGSRRPRARTRCIALLASAVALGGALPAAAAASSASSSEATLSVRDPNGRAAELLHRLSLPQLAVLLHTTPAQLVAQVGAPEGTLGLALGELASHPAATLQEVLDLLAAHGISAEPLEQVINRLLAGAGQSTETLRATVDAVLADLAEDGQISELAGELGLPPAVVEAANLLSSSGGQAAGSLNTTTEHLSNLLTGAGAATEPLAAATPLVISPLESTTEKATTDLLGMPNGAGGITLTTVTSTTPAQSSPAAAGAAKASVSNAFSIVSIKVTKGGLIVETVKLPGPGRLAINASAMRRVAVRSSGGRRRLTTRRATVASVATTVAGGTRTLTLRPRGAATRAARVAVALATTYTPTGGTPNTIKRNVIVKHAVRSKHRK